MSTVFISSGGTWQTTFSAALNANVPDGYQTYTWVMVMNAALFSVSGSKVRITFNAGTGAGWAMDAVYIGEKAAAGDAYDFAATPTQITFSGGSSGFSLSASGSILSDEITFTFDKTKNYCIAQDWGSTSSQARGLVTLTDCEAYRKIADDAATVDKTGYAGPGIAAVSGISLIEVLA